MLICIEHHLIFSECTFYCCVEQLICWLVCKWQHCHDNSTSCLHVRNARNCLNAEALICQFFFIIDITFLHFTIRNLLRLYEMLYQAIMSYETLISYFNLVIVFGIFAFEILDVILIPPWSSPSDAVDRYKGNYASDFTIAIT